MRLAHLCLRIPRPDLRGWLREDHSSRAWRLWGHQEEKHQALSPQRAPTFLVAPCRERGERLGRFGALVVGVTDDEAPRGEAMVPEHASHTGHPVVLGPLAGPAHPRQRRQRRRAEAGACKAGPANGVRHPNGRDTQGPPGPLRAGQRVVGLMRGHGSVNRPHNDTHEGGWLAKNHRRLQAIGSFRAPRGREGRLSPAETPRASSNGRTGAGRTI